MLTVTKLARKFGISRATLLYYEREGLLHPAQRSDKGYRWYGDKEISRLESIVSYRSFGVPVARILELLEQKSDKSQGQVLRDHFQQLEKEVSQLRNQQAAIIAVLQDPDIRPQDAINKEQWTAIMIASGFDDNAMVLWHQTFEKKEPEKHEAFLLSLGLTKNEIKRVRSY